MWHRGDEWYRKSRAGGLQLDQCGCVQKSRTGQDVRHTCTANKQEHSRDPTCVSHRVRRWVRRTLQAEEIHFRHEAPAQAPTLRRSSRQLSLIMSYDYIIMVALYAQKFMRYDDRNNKLVTIQQCNDTNPYFM